MDGMFQGDSQVTYRHMRDKVVIALQYFLGCPETIQWVGVVPVTLPRGRDLAQW